MAYTDTPETDEVWTITGLSQFGPISEHVQGNLGEFYSDWNQIDGKEARIFGKVKNYSGFNYKVQLIEGIISPTYPDGVWTVVSRVYLGDKIKVTGLKLFSRPKTCCSPSATICAACKMEFVNDQEAKGKVWNQWTKLWDKAQ